MLAVPVFIVPGSLRANVGMLLNFYFHETNADEAGNGMSEFVDSLHEVFTDFGLIDTKRMFGGYGIYHSSLMFGLVADDVLYLKADKQSEHRFEERGLSPFLYEKSGKQVRMSYFMAPDEIFDDPELAREWAVLAFEAALRADKQKKK